MERSILTSPPELEDIMKLSNMTTYTNNPSNLSSNQQKTGDNSHKNTTTILREMLHYKLPPFKTNNIIINQKAANFTAVTQTEASLAFILNFSLIIFILLRHKILLKRHTTKYFINLQSTHILMSLSALFSINNYYKELISVNNVLLMEMFLSLALTSFDRYVAISLPFYYQQYTTTTKVVAAITASWCVSLIFIVSIVIKGPTQQQLTIISTVLLPIIFALLACSNIRIYYIAKRHAKAISSCTITRSNDVKKNKSTMRINLTKSINSCLVIVLSFLLLWLPFMIHNLMSFSGTFTPHNNHVFTQTVTAVALLNSVVDPILYILYNRDIKIEIKRCLKRNSKKQKIDSKLSSSTKETDLINTSQVGNNSASK